MSAGYDLARLGSGRRLEFRESCDSTQDLAFALAEHGAPDGTVVLADEQARGRGRRGNAWDSPAGTGIWFSMILRPEPPAPPAPLLVAATAVAVAEAIESSGGPVPGIRWPNDLVVGDRKLAGILVETRDFEPRAPLLVLGIGLNVAQRAEEFPEGIRAEATSIALETGRAPDRTALLAAILESLDRWRESLPAIVEEAFRARVAYLGRRVRLLEGDEPVEGVLESASPVGGVFLRGFRGGWRAVKPEHARELRPLPDPPPPRIRPATPADAADIVRINGEVWRSDYREWFPEAVLEKRGRDPSHVDRVRARLETPGFVAHVAEEEGAIVGFVMAGEPRAPLEGFTAELYAIYVLSTSQGSGFGGALFASAAEGLGGRPFYLWTLRDNARSRGFYEHLGGRVVGERTVPVEGVETHEVAYGWGRG